MEQVQNIARHRKANQFSAANFFTGMYEEGERHDYIILHGGDELRKIIGAPNVDKKHSFRVMEMDGIPNTVMVVRKRFMKALLKCKTYSQLYNSLLQKLADNDIRYFFYPVWLGNHNFHARKDVLSSKRIANFNRKRGINGERISESSHRGMSIRQAAKSCFAL